jgi:hypothetical protein
VVHRIIQILLLVVLLSGCTEEVHEVVEEWQEKGWTKVRTHGVKKVHQRHSILMSEKAQGVEVSWIESGQRKTKLYRQDSHYYLALRFFCGDEDEFAVVMRKRK